jgi:uncharacterized heparinase superfamily protein
MMPGRLRRTTQMTLEEARWRTRELLATLHDRVHFRIRPFEWPATCESSVASNVATRLRDGGSRCVIDPCLAKSLREEITARWPDAAADATRRGDRLLVGLHDVLGYHGLRFSDWHSDPVHHARAPLVCWAEVAYLDPSIGDHKIIWELNRHQWWLQLARAYWLTGDSRYAYAIVAQMESWLDANPPLTGINWASMLEIGFRAISWTIAIHFLAGSDEYGALSPRCFIALERQLGHIEKHLSYYFSPNTHLTGEALALYVVGQAFPELASSKRWVDTGRRILLREIDRQILPDGGHVERSMHYQRYTLDFYLLALLTARRTGDVDAERSFAGAAARLADFAHAIADADGRLPLIGDDDGGMLWPIAGRDCADIRDSLATAAVVLERPHLAPWGPQEETFWIAAREALAYRLSPLDEPREDYEPFERALPRPSKSRTLRDTGYIVMRSGRDQAVFDVGVHGYMNGGHAHADALSLMLSIGGRPLLVDPGTASYTIDAQLRDRMRGSFNHNTVSVDGKPQSQPAGPFHWTTSANASLHACRHNAAFDWAEGAHDGYAPLEHRRSVFHADDGGWLVVDQVLRIKDEEGDGVHRVATHWHFHPEWTLSKQPRRALRATHLDGEEAWLLFDSGELSLVHGDDDSGLGWYAPVYGSLLPTWSVRIASNLQLPIAMISWIGRTSTPTTPDLQRIAVTADTYSEAIGARLIRDEFTSGYLFRTGEPSSRDGRASEVADYQTDARVLHVRTRDESLARLDLVDASHALALRDGWLSVAASESLCNLHIRLNDGVLQLSASEPPRELRILGRALRGIRAIRLNGRDYPLAIDEPDSLVITGADWTTAPLVRLGVRFALDEAHPAKV